MEIRDGYKIVATICMDGEPITDKIQLYSCFKYVLEHTNRELNKDEIRMALKMALREVA
jgi:hypothetical protein